MRKAGRQRRSRNIDALLTALVVVLSASQLLLIPGVVHFAPASPLEARTNAGVPRPPSARRRPPDRRVAAGRAAGAFNGYPVHYRNGTPPVHSSVSCVGEKYRPDAWMHRSCRFRHLCFHLDKKEFVLYQSQEERAMEDSFDQTFAFASNSMNTSVAIGGINVKRDVDRITNMRWFPRVVRGSLTEPYYELDPDVVWLPFHSFFAGNPGHLIWDDFLPIFTLMKMFNFVDDDGDASYRPLLTRHIFGEGRENGGLWSTCDWSDKNRQQCNSMYAKFLPLIGLHSDNFTTTHDVRWESSAGIRRSDLVCAAQGAAGIGMLTDHGAKLHGWEGKDYDFMHNHGRGPVLYEFRNFMAVNVLGEARRDRPKGPPYIVTIADLSSTQRRLRIDPHRKAAERAFGDLIRIRKVKFHGVSVREQVRIAASTAIYVTVCGGGAVTAMFLPRGSSAFLYYVENGGIEKNVKTGAPAMLDWDIFNNMAWIRSHWMPIKRMQEQEEIDAFVKLVGHELDIMMDEDSL